jgi:hypothetical protein
LSPVLESKAEGCACRYARLGGEAVKVVILGKDNEQVAVQLPNGKSLFVAEMGGKFHVYAMEPIKIRPMAENSIVLTVEKKGPEETF